MAVIACMQAFAQTDTIRLSTLSTTHLLSKDEPTYKSILAIKAKESFPYSTTVSVLESSGNMHTFIVMYDDSPERLIFNYRDLNNQNKKEDPKFDKTKSSPSEPRKTRSRRKLYHIADVEYGISFSCLDIWTEKDATWFSLCLDNKSGIRYDCSDALFVIENRKKVKRSLVYEKQISPLNTPDKLNTASGSISNSSYSFEKLAITKDQVLKVYLYESGGARNYILTMTPKDVNHASKK